MLIRSMYPEHRCGVFPIGEPCCPLGYRDAARMLVTLMTFRRAAP